MRIYLDTCCLQRPLDNQQHPRVRVETEAVFAVLCAIQSQEHSMIGSEALDYEVSRIPDDSRRTEALSMPVLASEHLEMSDRVESLATQFESIGIRAMDAVHLALASAAPVDFSCACDDKLVRRSQSIPNLGCQVVSRLAIIPEITK